MAIGKFDGPFSYLSNFWAVPHQVYGYPTNENFYQAMKTLDKKMRANIKMMTPGNAKRAGRTLVMRDDWEDIKVAVMLSGLRAKFQPNTQLAQALILTGDEELIEGNYWHDNYWGACMCPRTRRCQDVTGENMLGKLLMQVRIELKEGS